MSAGRILIVDDEANARAALDELLREEGYETATAADGLEALERLEAFDPQVVLTDLKMPRVDGLELLERGRAVVPHASFLVMTAFGSIDTAVKAIQRGADNYLTKPLDLDAVTALLAPALEKARLKSEAAELRERLDDRFDFGRIVGDHPAMQRLMKMVAQVARSRATALISGESGTGKELIAAAIHHNSKRADGPFIRLNCAALAETLLESELFGHEKGSFTGATGRRQGRFEKAHQGTLFLDEVSEIPLPTQVKLLRFLQERQFERVGGNDTIEVDVRIVAATNKSLPELVDAGRFREDLFYRLNVITLEVPPLRSRRTDIPLLAQHFLRKLAKDNEVEINGFTPEALQALSVYDWPGNVRELENAIERAVVLSTGEQIEVSLLPSSSSSRPSSTSPASSAEPAWLRPGLTLAEIERMVIERTLAEVDGSTARAAEALGISRRKIQYRLKEWAEEAAADAPSER